MSSGSLVMRFSCYALWNKFPDQPRLGEIGIYYRKIGFCACWAALLSCYSMSWSVIAHYLTSSDSVTH